MTINIDKTDFEHIHKRLQDYDEKREKLIAQSRKIVKKSKQLIYAIHRADKDVERIYREMLAEMKVLAQQTPQYMRTEGSYRMAIQEYVEAVTLYSIVKHRKLPTARQLRVKDESYLLGLCDLIGELVRRAVNCVIKENYKEAADIKEFVTALYAEFMNMDLRNGDLRRKVDGIKYGLKKLENLVLELKLKDKI